MHFPGTRCAPLAPTVGSAQPPPHSSSPRTPSQPAGDRSQHIADGSTAGRSRSRQQVTIPSRRTESLQGTRRDATPCRLRGRCLSPATRIRPAPPLLPATLPLALSMPRRNDPAAAATHLPALRQSLHPPSPPSPPPQRGPVHWPQSGSGRALPASPPGPSLPRCGCHRPGARC